ncbi:hypothetical protein M514_02036 [Trichuris suis]|uniref:Ubiquinol-cytochrome C reductase hinge domain-containing protein n=1 Tax=Trichuris suis TaxID=68888 RepID=A0A085N2A0_9BILA|nr:hypothetical protein M514_02036 [Trichuris suis]
MAPIVVVALLMAEEEIQDPLQKLREECKKDPCGKFVEALGVCTERVLSRKATEENCHDEVVDLMTCVDKCYDSWAANRKDPSQVLRESRKT